MLVAPADLIVVPVPIDEGSRSRANENVPDSAYEDGVGVPLDQVLDLAIESGDRIGQTKDAARQRSPRASLVALRTLKTGASGELLAKLRESVGKALVGLWPPERLHT